jgi:hypothetical protein
VSLVAAHDRRLRRRLAFATPLALVVMNFGNVWFAR